MQRCGLSRCARAAQRSGLRGGGAAVGAAMADYARACSYIDRPLLITGRKFDLRLYVLITCFDPLRIFLLEHAFPKVQRGSRDALPSRTRVAASPRNRALAM